MQGTVDGNSEKHMVYYTVNISQEFLVHSYVHTPLQELQPWNPVHKTWRRVNVEYFVKQSMSWIPAHKLLHAMKPNAEMYSASWLLHGAEIQPI
jgi:hypothetical protein